MARFSKPGPLTHPLMPGGSEAPYAVKIMQKYATLKPNGSLLRCEHAPRDISRKVVYPSQEAAQDAAAEMLAAGCDRQYPYVCPGCGSWHLTRERQRRQH